MPLSEVSGVASSSIAAIDEITSIAEVSDTAYPSGGGGAGTETVLLTYNFDDQTVATGTGATGWVPSLTHSQWGNGAAACSDSSGYWAPVGTPTNTGLTALKTSGQWRCDSNGTGSSSTGPAGALWVNVPGGVQGNPGTHNTSADTKYIYTETSGSLGQQILVCRSPGFNLSQIMSDPTNNDVELRFWVHGYGANCDRFQVWLDDAATSSAIDATNYVSYVATHTGDVTTGTTSWAGTAGGQHTTLSPSTLTYNNNSNSLWVQVTLSLNSIRHINLKHYLYFTHQPKVAGGVYYRGDVAIDQFEIVEIS